MSSRAIATAVAAFGIALTGAFALWMRRAPESLLDNSFENGFIELGTAAMFLLAAPLLLVATRRSARGGSGQLAFWPAALGWALFFVVCCGEELSWGQHMFGFQPPDSIAALNAQGELNFHNLYGLDDWLGGKYRWLTLFMATFGVALPLLARVAPVRPVLARVRFPVFPVATIPYFVGSYVFGKVFYAYANTGDAATEVREFIFAAGIFAAMWIGVVVPGSLHPWRGGRGIDHAIAPSSSDPGLSAMGPSSSSDDNLLD